MDLCLFCPSIGDSREHVFPAALGGRRYQWGLLCFPCNQNFGRQLDRVLAHGLSEVTRILGIRPDHRDASPPAQGEDRRLRRQFRRPADGSIECTTNEIRIVPKGRGAKILVNGDKNFIKCAEQVLARMANDDGDDTGQPMVFPGLVVDLRHRVTYGGRSFSRAVARVALNHLAAAYPHLARDAGRDEIKRFISGGRVRRGEHVPAWHDVSPPRLFRPSEAGSFQHVVTIILRPDLRRVFARIAFFRHLAWSVDLGPYDGPDTSSTVFEIDPLEETPNDRRSVVLPDVAKGAPVYRAPTKFEIRRTLEFFFMRLDTWHWHRGADDLIDKVNATRNAVAAAKRGPILAAILEPERQRLLGLLNRTVSAAPGVLGWPGSRMKDREKLRRLISAQRGVPFEVSRKTFELIETLRTELGETLSRRLTWRLLSKWELWQYLNGMLGAEIAFRLVIAAAGLRDEAPSHQQIASRLATSWQMD